MLIGQRNIALGDTRRIHVRYEDWLQKGALLSAVTVTVPAGTSSSIGTASLAPKIDVDERGLAFYVVSGTVLNENFIATIQVTDSLSQVVHDTMSFTIVSP